MCYKNSHEHKNSAVRNISLPDLAPFVSYLAVVEEGYELCAGGGDIFRYQGRVNCKMQSEHEAEKCQKDEDTKSRLLQLVKLNFISYM